MKTTKDQKRGKAPMVKQEASLDQLNEVVLFPGKVEKAKQVIEKIGLPKKSRINKKTGASQGGTKFS